MRSSRSLTLSILEWPIPNLFSHFFLNNQQLALKSSRLDSKSRHLVLLVTILPTVTQIPNAHLLAVNLMKKLSVIVILLDICGRCYKKFVWRKSRFPQIKRLKIFVLMSEPALNCENNAILHKTILWNCCLLLKWPILVVSA